MNKRNRGFTLIELLVVIAIIAVLTAGILVSMSNARKKARDSRRVADIKQVQLALEMYININRKYPTSLQDLVAGGQMASLPSDPSGGTAYSYAFYPAVNPTQYHLGASLERQSDIVLNSDKDCDSTDNNPVCAAGAGAYTGGFVSGIGNPESLQKCNAVDAGNYCYDIVP